jgi:hypothetical protein
MKGKPSIKTGRLTMGLLDDLGKPPARKFPCAVRAVISDLSKEDAEILIKAVADPNWGVATLSKTLHGKGIVLGQTPIKSHRNKTCSCGAE